MGGILFLKGPRAKGLDRVVGKVEFSGRSLGHWGSTTEGTV